jgi:N-methylhydantoinase A
LRGDCKLTRAEMLGITDRVVHGTTVATNALLERKGAKVALLTTEGHRDVIEMREGLKDNRYDLRSPPPNRWCRASAFWREANGSRPMARSRSAGRRIARRRYRRDPKFRRGTSVAVCFLHSYLNPAMKSPPSSG